MILDETLFCDIDVQRPYQFPNYSISSASSKIEQILAVFAAVFRFTLGFTFYQYSAHILLCKFTFRRFYIVTMSEENGKRNNCNAWSVFQIKSIEYQDVTPIGHKKSDKQNKIVVLGAIGKDRDFYFSRPQYSLHEKNLKNIIFVVARSTTSNYH